MGMWRELLVAIGRLAVWMVAMVLVVRFIPTPWGWVIIAIFLMGGTGGVVKEWLDYRSPYSENERGDFFTFPDAVEAFTGWWVTPLGAVIGALFLLGIRSPNILSRR